MICTNVFINYGALLHHFTCPWFISSINFYQTYIY